jgi:hypothetical protein
LTYTGYLIFFIVIGLWLDSKYNLADTPQNKAQYVATISELFGVSIALTEIFIIKAIATFVRASVNSLQSYSDISTVSIFLSQIKDDLIAKKFGKAILRLEKVRDVYQENLSSDELQMQASAHRTNYDKINSIISTLTIVDDTYTRNLSEPDLQDFVKFLTTFNETLISLKLTFKQSIL